MPIDCYSRAHARSQMLKADIRLIDTLSVGSIHYLDRYIIKTFGFFFSVSCVARRCLLERPGFRLMQTSYMGKSIMMPKMGWLKRISKQYKFIDDWTACAATATTNPWTRHELKHHASKLFKLSAFAEIRNGRVASSFSAFVRCHIAHWPDPWHPMSAADSDNKTNPCSRKGHIDERPFSGKPHHASRLAARSFSMAPNLIVSPSQTKVKFQIGWLSA